MKGLPNNMVTKCDTADSKNIFFLVNILKRISYEVSLNSEFH